MTQSTLPLSLHPKVAAFLAAIGGPGVIVLVLALILDDDTLLTVGLALLGGGAVGGAAGYKAPTADSEVEIGPASDDLLSAEAQAQLGG